MTHQFHKGRILTFDIAKALAIILVAIGHFDVEPSPSFYEKFRETIYTFHMPLFMFVSGFLCVKSIDKTSYLKFLHKKFLRLMLPYFVTSIIILVIKLCSEKYLPVEHPVRFHDFLEILWLPKAGYFLWFVYALWWMMMIAPVFNTQKLRILFLLLTIPLYFLCNRLPELFCIRETARFAVYFAAGLTAYDGFMKPSIRLCCRISSYFFPLLSAIAVFYSIENVTIMNSAWLLLTALSGISFSIIISNLIQHSENMCVKNTLYAISGASYIIYLFHTTFMGFAKAILVKLHFFSEGNLFIHYSMAELIVPILCGVFIPFLLYKYILKRYGFTRILFGL